MSLPRRKPRSETGNRRLSARANSSAVWRFTTCCAKGVFCVLRFAFCVSRSLGLRIRFWGCAISHSGFWKFESLSAARYKFYMLPLVPCCFLPIASSFVCAIRACYRISSFGYRTPPPFTMSHPPSKHHQDTTVSYMGDWVSNRHSTALCPPKPRLQPSDDNAPALEPHPQLPTIASRDTASILAEHIPTASMQSPQLTPTQRWLQESSREEPWRPFASPPQNSSHNQLRAERPSRTRSRADGTHTSPIARAESPQPRCGG
ncbi:hypothetical protein BDV95DRAFT_210111 [Massariosphaeria phaeospora]|uniref:Uncharacterized protein n=1 Tax=Massariosphaeria phaeospora TaxID=100035 RepID=A0A7C8M8B9_9PLEO|nr:hypothetical protein BDV95DRAFT_210111 [Massariosphaeria phaeospora]